MIEANSAWFALNGARITPVSPIDIVAPAAAASTLSGS
jgi:hypothetical protein